MPAARNVFIVLLLWALIYLPWLGTSGLRSEEGHRVLPAIEMLASGDYLVPHIGGEPYLRKPPLINWLVAGSFKLFGARNEWTARAPSFAAVLILALGLVTIARPLLGARGSLLAATAWLTSLGMMEKGRMIEIEAVYVTLFGLAFLCWLVWWQAERSPWLVWTVPWLFLGLGLLTKGPAHLFFFYALVLAILWQQKRTRELFHPAHLLGLGLMAAIFAAWAIPYSRAVATSTVSQTWSRELLGRFTGAEGTLNDWLLNFPLALAYFLPFGLLLPFVRFDSFPPNEKLLARGLFWGACLPCAFVLLLPGAIQRYILPTLVPISCLLGLAMRANAFVWRAPFSPRLVGAAIVLITLVAVIVFPLRSATVQKAHPNYAASAAPINLAVPSGDALYAVAPGYQPYLFYLNAPIHYLPTLSALPSGARYFIVPEKLRDEVTAEIPTARLLHRTCPVRSAANLFYTTAP